MQLLQQLQPLLLRLPLLLRQILLQREFLLLLLLKLRELRFRQFQLLQ
jgi:hypothetical protein